MPYGVNLIFLGIKLNVKKFIFSILLTNIITFSAKGVIILVHGTFAANATWCNPRGKFFQELENQARQFNQTIVPFTWSGNPKHIDIIQGSENLVKLIASYPKNEEIILIGHSHGGNVINFASRLLNDPVEEIMESQTIEEAYSEIFNIIDKILIRTNANPKNTQEKTLSNIDNNKNEEIISSIKKTLEEINNLKAKKQVDLKSKSKKHIIKTVYLLGTPIDTNIYSPSMRVIENLYNFYSLGDIIQTVLGLYQQTFPPMERITNLKILIKNCSYFSHNPGHIQLHDEIIAKWILHIPDIFDNFESENNGEIFFDGEKQPLYKVQTPMEIQEFFLDDPFAEQIDTNLIRAR